MTGFGKTLVGCTSLVHILLNYSDTHAIILCPQKAVKAFRKELSEKIRVPFNELTSSKQEINPNNRITIITHTSYKNHIDYIANLKSQNKRLILLLDEAHVCESSESKFYKLMAQTRQYYSICYFMTATPLKNNIEGLFWLFNLLDPRIFNSYMMFEQNFIVTKLRKTKQTIGKGKDRRTITRQFKEIIGYKNLDKLQEILKNYIIIKQKKYNLKFHYYSKELKDSEFLPYMRASEGLARETSEDNFAVRLHDLQKVVDNIEPESKVTDKLSSKEELFLQVILKCIREGHPTLVYCDYTEVVDRLETLLNLDICKKSGINKVLKVTRRYTSKTKRESRRFNR